MNISPVMKRNLMIGGGVAALGGFVWYMAQPSDAPRQQSAAPAQQPIMMYSPASSGGGSPVAGIPASGASGGGGDLPLLGALMGLFGAGQNSGAMPSGGSSASSNQPALMFLNSGATNTEIMYGAAVQMNYDNLLFDMYGGDAYLLASLGLTNGSAGFERDGLNTKIVIDSGPEKAPVYSPADIIQFLDAQADAGMPVNAASITALSQQYGVPLNQIGAAYGMSPLETQQWLAANSGSGQSASNAPLNTGSGSTPTIAQPTQPQSSLAETIMSIVSAAETSGQIVDTNFIMALSNQYGVGVEQIGSYFGKTPDQTYQWLVANDNKTVTPAPAPTVAIPKMDDVEMPEIRINFNEYERREAA